MKIAYLVLAHNNPGVLRRAVGKLSSEDSDFFVHIDQKTDIQTFAHIGGQNVYFSPRRLPVYWGEFSQVRAILLLLCDAMNSRRNYDYFVLISGTDYPLRSAPYIHAFLEHNYGVEFISLARMPARGKPISRVNTLRYPSDKPVLRFAVRALAKVGMAQRDYREHLGGLEPYSGSTWWALSRDACRYILEFVPRHPHVEGYFQNTFAPDESFFHTILGNSIFRPRIRRNVTFDDWSVGGGHPATISEAHVTVFEAADKVWVDDMYGSGEVLFARKCSDNNLALLQRIDDMIRRNMPLRG